MSPTARSRYKDVFADFRTTWEELQILGKQVIDFIEDNEKQFARMQEKYNSVMLSPNPVNEKVKAPSSLQELTDLINEWNVITNNNRIFLEKNSKLVTSMDAMIDVFNGYKESLLANKISEQFFITVINELEQQTQVHKKELKEDQQTFVKLDLITKQAIERFVSKLN